MEVITVTIYPAAPRPSSLAVWKEDDGFCCHIPKCLNKDIMVTRMIVAWTISKP